jgi:limonene-1,2-epoxide hydrolase
MMGIGGEVDVDVTHMVADGSIVMIERIDYWKGPDGTVALRVMGIFEVQESKITAWRDHFDGNEFMSQVLPGA